MVHEPRNTGANQWSADILIAVIVPFAKYVDKNAGAPAGVAWEVS